MKDVWIPKPELQLRYKDKISTVGFGGASLAVPESTQVNSFWAIGGQMSVDPMELESKIINLFLSMFGSFRDVALKFYGARDEYPFFKSNTGEQFPLEYVIRLIHSSRQDLYCPDRIVLRSMIPYISSGFEGRAHVVHLMDVSRSVPACVETYSYDTTVVGCLDSQPRLPRVYKIGAEF